MTNLEKKNKTLSTRLKLILSIFLLPLQYLLLTQGLDWSSVPILNLFSPLLIPLSIINLIYILSVIVFDYLVSLIPEFSNFIRNFFYPIISLLMFLFNYFLITLLYRIWSGLFSFLKKKRD